MVTDGRKHFMDYITFKLQEVQWFSTLFAISSVSYYVESRYLRYNKYIESSDLSYLNYTFIPIYFSYIFTIIFPLKTPKKDEARNSLRVSLNPGDDESEAFNDASEREDEVVDYQHFTYEMTRGSLPIIIYAISLAGSFGIYIVFKVHQTSE